MDEKIERLISFSGNSHMYQYILFCLSFFSWSNLYLVPVVLPLLEKVPDVQFVEEGRITVTQLNYTICQWENNFTIHTIYPYSWVSDFGISCDPIKTGLVGVITFIGNFLGALTFHYFADSIGRRNTIVISTLFFVISNLGCVACENFYSIMVLSFIVSITSIFISYAALVTTEEMISPEKRSIFGGIITSGYQISAILYIIFLYYIPSWRIAMTVCACVALVVGLGFQFLTFESPRRYIARNEFQKAVEILQQIADVNHKGEEFKASLRDPQNKELIAEISSNTGHFKNSGRKLITSIALIKFPSLRYKFLILSLLWFLVCGNYNAICIQMKSLPGSIYFNGILLYFFELISVYVSSMVINIPFLGRKKSLLLYYMIILIGYGCLIFLIMEDFRKVLVVLIIRFAIAGIYAIFFIYAVEIYPTNVRALGMGLNCAIANIGGFIFPMIIELLDEHKCNVLFAGMNALCFSLMFSMSETVGLPLPETITELEAGSEVPADIQKNN